MILWKNNWKIGIRKLADWRAPKGEDRGVVRRKTPIFDCAAYAHEALLSALMPDRKVILSYRPKKTAEYQPFSYFTLNSVSRKPLSVHSSGS